MTEEMRQHCIAMTLYSKELIAHLADIETMLDINKVNPTLSDKVLTAVIDDVLKCNMMRHDMAKFMSNLLLGELNSISPMLTKKSFWQAYQEYKSRKS